MKHLKKFENFSHAYKDMLMSYVNKKKESDDDFLVVKEILIDFFDEYDLSNNLDFEETENLNNTYSFRKMDHFSAEVISDDKSKLDKIEKNIVKIIPRIESLGYEVFIIPKQKNNYGSEDNPIIHDCLYIKIFEDDNELIIGRADTEINENFDSVTEEQIENYLKEHFTSDWFDSELSERVHDYISADEAEDYDDNYEEAYKNLSTGAAVEYDLLKDMSDDICENFKIDADTKIDKRSVRDICHDHLMDTCTWYDKYIFNRRSTEPYKNSFFGNSYQDLMRKWNDD